MPKQLDMYFWNAKNAAIIKLYIMLHYVFMMVHLNLEAVVQTMMNAHKDERMSGLQISLTSKNVCRYAKTIYGKYALI